MKGSGRLLCSSALSTGHSAPSMSILSTSTQVWCSSRMMVSSDLTSKDT